MMNEKLRNGEWEIGNKAYEWGMGLRVGWGGYRERVDAILGGAVY
jgi:hypothetical protein